MKARRHKYARAIERNERDVLRRETVTDLLIHGRARIDLPSENRKR